MLQIPGYHILVQLHESINSQVFRGVRESDGLPVIVKILRKDYPNPEEITRYKLEYEIISSLSLDGVVKAYSLQQYSSTFAIMMEDFGGESLEKILFRKKYTLLEFLELAVQICHILGLVHAANIVHTDCRHVAL